MIKELQLERFKKFEDIKLSFTPFSVLMGENSSGKTTILQALNLALLSLNTYELITIDGQNKVKVRPKGVGLTKLPGIELSDFRELYYAKISRSSRKGTTGSNIILKDELDNIYRLQVTSLFGGFNIKCNSAESELINNPVIQKKPPLFISGFVGLTPVEERVFPVALTDRLRSGHVSSIIRNLVYDTKENKPDQYERLRSRLAKDFNFHINTVFFDEEKDLYVQAQYSEVCEEKRLSLDFNVSGSGYMQILQILAPIYIFCPDSSNIVLLDEPDAHLHPNLQTTLANSLRKIQQELKIQIIISTHSTSIIRATNPSNVVPVSTVTKECKPLTNRTDIEENIKSKIDSYSLAKSVISGKLIFFEDRDLSLWEEIDDVLETHVFKGSNTSPIIRGRGKTDRIPFQIKDIINELLGEEIEIIFIRDGDGLTQEWRDKLIDYANNSGVNLQILNYFELDSYLLNEELIYRVLKTKYPQKTIPSKDEINSKIKEYLKSTIILARFNYDDCLEEEIYQICILMNIDDYRNPQIVKSEVRYWHTKLEDIDELEDLLRFGMGKEALKQLFNWLNNELKMNISKNEIISELKVGDIPEEFINILKRMRSKEQRYIPELYEDYISDDTTEKFEEMVENLILDFGDE